MEVNTNTDHIIDGFIDIRKKKKLSQAAVAKRADLHQAAVGRIENKSTIRSSIQLLSSLIRWDTRLQSFLMIETVTML